MAGLPLAPLTELDAVNAMLLTVGQQPVNTLEASGISDVAIARNILHQTSRQVQVVGLWFNSESRYPLSLDVNGYAYLPENTLKVDPSDPTKNYVQRGNRLYDRENHTFIFKTTPIEVDIVFFLDFKSLPEVARDYIAIRAARIYQTKVMGSETLYQLSAMDEQQAYLALRQAESDIGDFNFFNSVDLAQMLRR